MFLSYVVKFFRPISWSSVEIKPALANNFIFPPSSNFFLILILSKSSPRLTDSNHQLGFPWTWQEKGKKGVLGSFCQEKLSVSSSSLLFKSFTIAKLVRGMSFFLLKQNHVRFISNTSSANVGFSQYLLPLLSLRLRIISHAIV